MAVEVYYWVGVPGHVALMVDAGIPGGKEYMSAWPADTWGGLALDVFAAGPVVFAKDLAADKVSEGGTAPHVCRLTKLDETAIKLAIKTLKGPGHHWSLFGGGTCANHVAMCLSAGVTSPAISVGRAPLLMSPWTVWLYAQSLRALYA
jgi:hypothetical protein